MAGPGKGLNIIQVGLKRYLAAGADDIADDGCFPLPTPNSFSSDDGASILNASIPRLIISSKIGSMNPQMRNAIWPPFYVSSFFSWVLMNSMQDPVHSIL